MSSGAKLLRVCVRDLGLMNCRLENTHAREAEKLQDELIRRMTPERRLEIARELYETDWQLKEAGLRRQHPDWPEDEIWGKCRRIFATGYAGA